MGIARSGLCKCSEKMTYFLRKYYKVRKLSGVFREDHVLAEILQGQDAVWERSEKITYALREYEDGLQGQHALWQCSEMNTYNLKAQEGDYKVMMRSRSFRR